MTNPGHEIPENWGDPIGELRASCEGLPEDEEDRWIREGQARYEAMTPEERTEHDREISEELERFQQPGVMEAIDKAFRNGFTRS